MEHEQLCPSTILGPHPELSEATIGELQEKMRCGELTSHALVEMYLERIAAIDPKIRSIIEINSDAQSIAIRMDEERKLGELCGPLHGIPVLIKDNIETCDTMRTTAGSLALLEAPTPERDAFLVEQARQAGAVILGKTNLSEWSNFRSTNSISGWSGRGGQTNNPYVLDKNPCGSSSGTGAAISAGLAAVGIGTETNGSIICPAVQCGLVGIKPTLGLISRSGIIPIAHSQDTAGPMARTVVDATTLLGALVGYDETDPITSQSRNGHPDYSKFLNKEGLSGARIGVPPQFFEGDDQHQKQMESHLRTLEEGGATLIDIQFPKIEGFWDDEHQVLLCEFKADLNRYLAARNSPYRSLADLIRFNEENPDLEMPLFGQELFLQAQEKGNLESAEYLQALQRIKLATQINGIDAVMEKDNLDAIVSPTGGDTWALAAVAGYPYITVPAGFSNGLPIGMGFFGRAFSEPQLLKLAYSFEQRTALRQTPRFLPTLDEQASDI
jgi:amidase